MSRKYPPLQRLLDRARAAPSAGDDDSLATVPLGFATRVVAQAWSDRATDGSVSLVQLLRAHGHRFLVAAAAVAVLSAVLNLSAVADDIEYDVLSGDDPVTAMMDYSQ